VQGRVECDGVQAVPVPESVQQGARDEGVAVAAGGQLERGRHVLDLDPRRDRHAGVLGALGELASRRPLLGRLPIRAQERVTRALIDVALGAPERYGLPAPATRNLHRNRPVVNGQLLHFIHHGRVRVAPGIERFDGHDVSFTDGTSRAFDTIVFATGFKATLPFLDGVGLEREAGVPLRVAGMTLPVGLERLYFVGLAAPRGPQLPVYSAQARLVAKFLRAHERGAGALTERLGRGTRPESRVDIPRHEWTRDMARAHKRIDRVLRGRPQGPRAAQLATERPAVHR
jgi:hypothetical protein